MIARDMTVRTRIKMLYELLVFLGWTASSVDIKDYSLPLKTALRLINNDVTARVWIQGSI
jgi:hypothetical protein